MWVNVVFVWAVEGVRRYIVHFNCPGPVVRPWSSHHHHLLSMKEQINVTTSSTAGTCFYNTHKKERDRKRKKKQHTDGFIFSTFKWVSCQQKPPCLMGFRGKSKKQNRNSLNEFSISKDSLYDWNTTGMIRHPRVSGLVCYTRECGFITGTSCFKHKLTSQLGHCSAVMASLGCGVKHLGTTIHTEQKFRQG